MLKHKIKRLLFMVVMASLPPSFASGTPVEVQGQKTVFSEQNQLIQLRQMLLGTVENTTALSELKETLVPFLNELLENGHVQMAANDEKARPLFVTSQGLIEQNLALQLEKGELKKLVGIIHTPTPATPLCTQGDITERLVDPSMQNDEKRLYTVRARANIVRDYLDLGGELFVIYPQGGLEKRTEEQKQVYLNTLTEYSEKSLFDCQLPIAQMDSDMVGATYLFSMANNEQYLFAIKATQANAPEDQRTWEMWLGPVSNNQVRDRLDRVQSFLNMHGAPSLEL